MLLTYGKHPKTLATVRSLGRASNQVVVTDDMASPLSAFSKYCHKFVKTSIPSVDSDAFIRELDQICRGEDIELMIPMDDPECDLLSAQSASTTLKTTVAMPPEGIYDIARDKAKTVKLAEELGVEVPMSRVVRNTDELEEAIVRIGLPAIVKPLRSSGSRGFRLIEKNADVVATSGLFDAYGPLLAQEFVKHGGAVGVSYLLDHGKTKAVFAHRRLLEFPDTGGASIVSESIRHPEAELAGKTILEHVGWHGVAMVEFRLDGKTGRPMLMEINPRFWGTLQLAISSGVDFPVMLCKMYAGGDVRPVDTYRTGIRCVSLLPRGIASALAPGGARRLAKTLRYASKSRCFYVESFDDPMPALGSALGLLRFAVDQRMTQSFFREETQQG